MKSWARRGRYYVGFSLAAFVTPLALAQSTAIDVAWLPISDAERNMKTPIVDKNAGEEAIFWRVHVRDEVTGGNEVQRVFYNYVRLKIFNEKGKEQATTIDLPFSGRTSILAVAGRTTKADGTELELNKDSIYERDLIRAGSTRVRVKSFAMPGVEPGAIVEYRWREVETDPRTFYIRVQFQREFPMQRVTYFFAPLSSQYTSYRMLIVPFHCQLPPLQDDRQGYQFITLDNIPAFQEEPMMPGEPNVRMWALVSYTNEKNREPDKYWAAIGKDEYSRFKSALKANDQVKDASASATAGANTDEEKVLGLIRYIRRNLRDLFSAQVTEAERARILKDMPNDHYRGSWDVLKSGIGTPNELNLLFASMANAVGLEARPALIGDRQDVLFTPAMTDRYFLRNVDMAVNIGGSWKLYDVSAQDLPSNMISWTEEGMHALISDPKTPSFTQAPIAAPEASARVRNANLTLSQDGAIEGDIDLQYSGHSAQQRRYELESGSETRQVERYKEEVIKEYPNSEISDIRIENAADPEKPLSLHYHLKLEGYAQRTGKRILLQPFFFERGAAPVFSAVERKYPVYFPYAWKEHDSVTFNLPAGFVLDNADAPGSLDFGAPGSYKVKILTRGSQALVLERDLIFGKEGRLFFGAETYPQLKNAFDLIHTRDGHTISLKQAVVAEAK